MLLGIIVGAGKISGRNKILEKNKFKKRRVNRKLGMVKRKRFLVQLIHINPFFSQPH